MAVPCGGPSLGRAAGKLGEAGWRKRKCWGRQQTASGGEHEAFPCKEGQQGLFWGARGGGEGPSQRAGAPGALGPVTGSGAGV